MNNETEIIRGRTRKLIINPGATTIAWETLQERIENFLKYN